MSKPGLEYIPIPYEVFTDSSLSHGAKLLFGRLKVYAGKDGKAFPKHETLAGEMCVSARQVRSLLVNLKARNMIDWTRTRSSCIFEIKPREEWKRVSDLDGKGSSALRGSELPPKSGNTFPQEKSYRRPSPDKSSLNATMQHRSSSAPKDDAVRSALEEVEAALRQRAVVRCVFCEREKRVVQDWLADGVTVELLLRAILLGCQRKVKADLNSGTRSPIVSIRYFALIVDEVRKLEDGVQVGGVAQPLDPGHWKRVESWLKRYEPQWLDFRTEPERSGDMSPGQGVAASGGAAN